MSRAKGSTTSPSSGAVQHRRTCRTCAATRSIQQPGFPIPLGGEFDDDERRLLTQHGRWLESLADGVLSPATPEQRQFVLVARGEAEPQSPFEFLWVKYLQAVDAAALPVGPLELANQLSQLQAARAAAAAARDECSARRKAILRQVQPQLDALDAEFAERLAATEDEATRLEAAARRAVLKYGASFRHAGVIAVYARGRVTWDSRGLERYLKSHPELSEFRRVNAPLVSLRFQKPPEAAPK